MEQTKDRNGSIVRVGTRVRLVSLSGKWLEELPAEERARVLSMIGEEFEVEELDQYGHAWVCKWWPGASKNRALSHSIALDSAEMEVVAIERIAGR